MTITEIYNEHKESVFNHVLMVVKNRSNSEEITNDIFLKLDNYEYNPKNENGASLESWIRTITNSVILDFFRSKQNKKQLKQINVDRFTNEDGSQSFQFISPTSIQADKIMQNNLIKNNIDFAFNSLNINHKDIATFFYIHEYKIIEIAEMLNIPVGTVKGTLNRIRAKLQKSLKVAVTA